MRLRLRFAAALSTLSAVSGLPAADLPLPPGRDASPQVIEAGRQLFTMNFARPDRLAKGVKLGDNGNGVGPLFNDTSCVGCHNQGGAGGGGDLNANVFMLGIVTRPAPAATVPEILKAAHTVHRGMTDAAPVQIVHQFAIGNPEDVEAYDKWRDDLLDQFGGRSTLSTPKPVRKRVGPITMELTQRNSPALWGIGLIDALHRGGGNELRRRIAQEQSESSSGVSGRVPITPDGEEGWYGWRGQISSLDRMVRSACAIELGLQVPGAREAVPPFPTSQPVARSTSKKAQLDLTEPQVVALTSFVRELPRPERDVSTSEIPAHAAIASGERVFDRVGCAECHRPDLGWARGIYSDMLLHDMGDYDEDVQATMPEIRSRTITSTQVSGGGVNVGYGSSVSLSVSTSSVTLVQEIPTEREQEWKTPPLWGIRDSAPYYHDGRAATLKEAIEIHGGEAEKSAAAFRQLDQDDQQALLAFLGSLKAPASADQRLTP